MNFNHQVLEKPIDPEFLIMSRQMMIMLKHLLKCVGLCVISVHGFLIGIVVISSQSQGPALVFSRKLGL
jgi:hypothetical protein